MSDRCYLVVRVHPQDVEKAASIIAEHGPEYPEHDSGTWELSEQNYGGHDVLRALRRSRVRFVGRHSAGCEYGPAVVHSNGEPVQKGCEYPRFCEAGHEGDPVVMVMDDGEPEGHGLDDARAYIAADAAMEEAWSTAERLD